MGIILVGFCGAENSGQKADDTVGHCEGGKLATSEDKIANCETVSCDLGGYALVDPFVMTTNENDMVKLGKSFSVSLGESFAGRVSENDRGFGGWLTGLDSGFDDRSHENHSGATTVGRIINGSVFIGGEIARGLSREHNEILINSARYDAVAESGEHHFGEKRYEIYLHCAELRVPLVIRCVSGLGLRVNLLT